jgi:hypothetical protein
MINTASLPEIFIRPTKKSNADATSRNRPPSADAAPEVGMGGFREEDAIGIITVDKPAAQIR